MGKNHFRWKKQRASRFKKKKKNVLCAQERLGSQELKGKEEPDTAGLKSLCKEIELFSGVSQKSLRKAFRKGRKQLVCLC